MMNTEKNYLNLYHKFAYGSGDFGTNFCYTFISSFILIYLTNTVGLQSGIIGTLMLISRVLDGITDVIAGTIIDKTHKKMGKARFWMLVTIPFVGITEFMLFNIPSAEKTIQYAYFFVIYTLLNDVFYTLNNVAYSTLAVLVTKNKNERVQLGAFRYIGTTIAGVIVNTFTVGLVSRFGDGVQGWRLTALLYSVLYIVFSLACVLPLKELPDEEAEDGNMVEKKENSLIDNIKYLVSNPYFIQQLMIQILGTIFFCLVNAAGVYYCTYILEDASVLGVFSMAMIGYMLGLIITPALVNKIGIYKTNLYSYVLTTLTCVVFALVAGTGSIPLMFIVCFLRYMFSAPSPGNSAALTAEISNYTYMKKKVRIEASVFACASMGSKVGAGLGTAIVGWLLQAGGFDGTVAVQSQSALNMISFMYTWLPVIFCAISTVILVFQKVEEANEKLKQAQ